MSTPPASRLRAPRLGAHTSIAGGLHRALERGAEYGCDVIQLFTKSNQQWAARAITEEDRASWRSARARTGVEPVMAHASYLINLASPEPAVWARSVRALAEELRRCHLLDVPFLVVHPGAHLGTGEAHGIARVARAVNEALAALPDTTTTLLLENTAGAGTSLGYRFEHLREIFASASDPWRLGVCVDTCHALAAGYDVTGAAGWARTLDALDRAVGLARVHAFHVNDSKRPLGSRVDRHEHLGHGEIGLEGLRCLLNEPLLAGLPMVIETPKPTPEADAVNLAVLRALCGSRRVSRAARALAARKL